MEKEKKVKPLVGLIIHFVIWFLLNKYVPSILFIVPLIYAVVCLYYSFAQLKKDSNATGLEKFLAISLILYAGFKVFVVVFGFFLGLGIFSAMVF